MSDLIELDKIPNLDEFVPASTDLSSEYWSPEEGEERRLVFWEIENRRVPDFNDASRMVDLECVVCIEPRSEGEFSTVVNGSKRLVAAIRNNDVQKGTPVLVRHLGKKVNRTNQNKSDHWEVFTLKPGS